MENDLGAGQASKSPQAAHSHKRAPSASSLLSKLSFMRSPTETNRPTQGADSNGASTASGAALASALQQTKTRRRRGSLRKVALLGRGAQRERRDSSPLTIDTQQAATLGRVAAASMPDITTTTHVDRDALGLLASDITPVSKATAQASRPSLLDTPTGPSSGLSRAPSRHADAANPIYTSTTDEEDVLQISHNATPRQTISVVTGSDSYFSGRRRSFHHAKSPLSYSGLASTTIPPADIDSDYAETAWWGWVVLTVTWLVFVIGMGSCLDIWSWAWDVGKTPYAPPELEDDPTLPIVGYYPALIILTGVMAWVWVVVAWVGMKYFRHAQISGD